MSSSKEATKLWISIFLFLICHKLALHYTSAHSVYSTVACIINLYINSTRICTKCFDSIFLLTSVAFCSTTSKLLNSESLMDTFASSEFQYYSQNLPCLCRMPLQSCPGHEANPLDISSTKPSRGTTS